MKIRLYIQAIILAIISLAFGLAPLSAQNILAEQGLLAARSNSYLLQQNMGAMAAVQETGLSLARTETAQPTEAKTFLTDYQPNLLDLCLNLKKGQASWPSLYNFSGRLSDRYTFNNVFSLQALDNPFSLESPSRLASIPRDTYVNPVGAVLTELFNYKTQKTNHIPAWFVLVGFSMLALLSVLLTNYRQDTQRIVQAFGNSSLAGQLFRDQHGMLNISQVLFQVQFTLGLGSLCFLGIQKWGDTGVYGSSLDWLLCVGLAGLFQVLKHAKLELLALLFPFRQELKFYSFLLANTSQILGFVLLPLLMGIAYGQESIQDFCWVLATTGLGLGYAYSCFRGIAMSLERIMFHKFHFFIYLCTVEIAPLLIAYKLLQA